MLGLLALRYVPAYLDARSALDTARRLASQARSMGVADVNRDTLAQLRGEVAGLEHDLGATRDFLAMDPLVGVAQSASASVRDQVDRANQLIRAADRLADAAGVALGLGDQFVTLREGDPKQLLGGLVGIVATARPDVARVGSDLDTAQAILDRLSPASGTLGTAADEMRSAIAFLRPLLGVYDSAADLIPEMLGYGGERRYLVLAENPAELRPSGGYTGTYGVVTFRNGNLAEQQFRDIYLLDFPQAPYIQPPEALVEHLLGANQGWKLADANWSPDWPTSAQAALRLYSNESGDTKIDGVIALTTYAVDKILEVTGPVDVPGYDTSVAAGSVTLTALAHTRGEGNDPSRKAFLDALASAVLDRVQALPPEQIQPMVDAFQDVAAQRLIMVWSANPGVESLLAAGPIGGVLRQADGDFLAVSEANVAPTSKLNLVIQRSTRLAVSIAADGSAQDQLDLAWQNDAAKPGEPYASLRSYSVSQEGNYGAYVRVLVPNGSRVLDATGNAGGAISGVESIDAEAGRTSLGNYLLMPPGPSSLSYRYTSATKATEADGAWTYRLTVQKQPGALPEPLSLAIALPDGAVVVKAPTGAKVDGGNVSFATTLQEDLDVAVTYTLP